MTDTPKFDLPSTLAAMSDYPEVLKRFGIVRTIEVDIAGSGLDPATAGTVTVKAEPTWERRITDPTALHVAPVVVPGVLSPTHFGLTQDGLIDPVTHKLGVLEIDTESATIKHVDLARQVTNADTTNAAAPADGLDPIDRPTELSLPTLRNAGLSVFQGDRGPGLQARLNDTKGLLRVKDDPYPLADPSHAYVGHVVDVWDNRTNRWHTLCARRGTYTLPNGASFTADDLGAVSSTVTQNVKNDAAPMYLHQSLFRWTGWSLVAAPPGQPVITESEGRRPEAPAEDDLPIPGFTVSFEALPGSLPVLRYGRRYRFQLRGMDVAGNVAPLNVNSTDFSKSIPPAPAPPFPFLRFEPIITPVVMAAHPMSEGESVATLVVRPVPGVVGVISNLLAPILGSAPVRHVAPPKVPQLLCEHHGVLDTAAGVPDPSKYNSIADRDRADLAEIGTPDPRAQGQRYLEGTNLPVAWLSDPISRFGVINGLPGGPVKVNFDPDPFRSWPALHSFRIQLNDGPLGSQWNPLSRLLQVFVPRGETVRVRLSSAPNEADLSTLGQLQWLAESSPAPSAATLAAVRADVLAGKAWQITPYRTLTLVNAVRVPVTPPNLQSITATAPPRALGATSQVLEGNASVHRPSTGQLALVGTWTDPIDEASDPLGPTEATRTASPTIGLQGTGATKTAVLDIAYDADPATGNSVRFAATHLFRDTNRHEVDYHLIGTTRYLEQFVHRGDVTLVAETPVQLSTAGIIPGTDQVRSLQLPPANEGEAPPPRVPYTRDRDYSIDYAAGTIRRVPGGDIPAGTTVEVAIIAPPVSNTSQSRHVSIPSSARPAPPSVAWIVPSFGWTETLTNQNRTRTRVRGGGGLRIFLDRPWYSSGVGEQLGVVVADTAVASGDREHLDLVTQLARDPALTGADVAGQFPTKEQFSLATQRMAGLTLPEMFKRGGGQPKFGVAGHDVVWDGSRQRWWTDIALPPGNAYRPFVRLALARFQPVSVVDAHLSAVADVEWAQLSPDRSLTMVFDARDARKVNFTLVGRGPTGGAAPTTTAPAARNRVAGILQQAPRDDTTDLAWTTVGAADGTVLTGTPQADGTTIWTWALTLPSARTTVPYRVVFTEHEQVGGGLRLSYTDTVRL